MFCDLDGSNDIGEFGYANIFKLPNQFGVDVTAGGQVFTTHLAAEQKV